MEANKPRILFVTGVPGAGKSTVAREIVRVTGWPLVDIDETIGGPLLGPVFNYEGGGTHGGFNVGRGDAAHAIVEIAARVRLTRPEGGKTIFVVPMIRRERQEILARLMSDFPGQIFVVRLTLDDKGEAERRLASRVGTGYTGGVNDLCEWCRVKGTEHPLSVSHFAISTESESPDEIATTVLALFA